VSGELSNVLNRRDARMDMEELHAALRATIGCGRGRARVRTTHHAENQKQCYKHQTHDAAERQGERWLARPQLPNWQNCAGPAIRSTEKLCARTDPRRLLQKKLQVPAFRTSQSVPRYYIWWSDIEAVVPTEPTHERLTVRPVSLRAHSLFGGINCALQR
jgi:hypothetical protein